MMAGLNCGSVSAMRARIVGIHGLNEFGVPARRCGGAALAGDGSRLPIIVPLRISRDSSVVLISTDGAV
jgi:hypothetical protein